MQPIETLRIPYSAERDQALEQFLERAADKAELYAAAFKMIARAERERTEGRSEVETIAMSGFRELRALAAEAQRLASPL